MRPITVPYRRKRERRTHYQKRARLLLSGKPRLVVRVTNRKLIAQLQEFAPQGDKVVVGLDSTRLHKLGWPSAGKSIPAAYLTGLLMGKEALQKGRTEAILDTGFTSAVRKGVIAAFLQGAVEQGLHLPHDPAIFPSAERLAGKHLKSDTGEKFKEIVAKIKSSS